MRRGIPRGFRLGWIGLAALCGCTHAPGPATEGTAPGHAPASAPTPPPSAAPSTTAPAADPGPSPARTTRDVVDSLTFPPLVFAPPEATEHEVLGVPVFHLHDDTFPLVDIFLQFRGGVNHLSRADAPAMTALSSLLRNGGTQALEPDSVEAHLDLLAVQLATGSGGTGAFAAINALSPTVDPALELLRQIVGEPRFDSAAVEVWLEQERDRIRRREEDPGSLAFAEFNRLLFGDHPVGWVFTEDEITTRALSMDRLRRLHALVYCRENLLVGVAGDLSWDDASPRIRRLVEAIRPCPTPLPPLPVPVLRRGGGVWVLPRPGEQTTLVVAGPGGVRLEDSPEYFASRLANQILGAGGFGSRLFQRVRTEEGLAYGAASVWTTPLRHEGIVGATTATRPERAVEALDVVFEVLEEFRRAPPTLAEVTLAVDQAVNGYVFAFESAAQVVNRRMGDRAQGLPDGWLERYLEQIQSVTPSAIHQVVRQHLDLDAMVILLVGDAERFGPGLERFGPVWRLDADGRHEPWNPGPPPAGTPPRP